jgi:hypothetical protein
MFAGFMMNTWAVATIVAPVAGVVGFFVVLRGSAFPAPFPRARSPGPRAPPCSASARFSAWPSSRCSAPWASAPWAAAAGMTSRPRSRWS